MENPKKVVIARSVVLVCYLLLFSLGVHNIVQYLVKQERWRSYPLLLFYICTMLTLFLGTARIVAPYFNEDVVLDEYACTTYDWVQTAAASAIYAVAFAQLIILIELSLKTLLQIYWMKEQKVQLELTELYKSADRSSRMVVNAQANFDQPDKIHELRKTLDSLVQKNQRKRANVELGVKIMYILGTVLCALAVPTGLMSYFIVLIRVSKEKGKEYDCQLDVLNVIIPTGAIFLLITTVLLTVAQILLICLLYKVIGKQMKTEMCYLSLVMLFFQAGFSGRLAYDLIVRRNTSSLGELNVLLNVFLPLFYEYTPILAIFLHHIKNFRQKSQKINQNQKEEKEEQNQQEKRKVERDKDRDQTFQVQLMFLTDSEKQSLPRTEDDPTLSSFENQQNLSQPDRSNNSIESQSFIKEQPKRLLSQSQTRNKPQLEEQFVYEKLKGAAISENNNEEMIIEQPLAQSVANGKQTQQNQSYIQQISEDSIQAQDSVKSSKRGLMINTELETRNQDSSQEQYQSNTNSNTASFIREANKLGMLEFTELPSERTPTKLDTTEKTVLLSNKKALNQDSNTSGTATNLFVQMQSQLTQNGDSLPESQQNLAGQKPISAQYDTKNQQRGRFSLQKGSQIYDLLLTNNFNDNNWPVKDSKQGRPFRNANSADIDKINFKFN